MSVSMKVCVIALAILAGAVCGGAQAEPQPTERDQLSEILSAVDAFGDGRCILDREVRVLRSDTAVDIFVFQCGSSPRKMVLQETAPVCPGESEFSLANIRAAIGYVSTIVATDRAREAAYQTRQTPTVSNVMWSPSYAACPR